MIVYDRLWDYLKEHGVSQYKLYKQGISHSTMSRLHNNESVHTETINKLCSILHCKVEDIMEYVDDEV